MLEGSIDDDFNILWKFLDKLVTWTEVFAADCIGQGLHIKKRKTMSWKCVVVFSRIVKK